MKVTKVTSRVANCIFLSLNVPEIRTEPLPLFMYTQTEITLCVARSMHGNQESIQNDLL